MPERSVNSALRSSLLNNDAFAYAHLVKFEKPSLTSQVEGATSEKATDYAYITDASQDILFNDGSTDSQGNANGIQVYRANKLISVGTVSETTEARASNMAIKLYATTLGTSASDSFAISSGSLAGATDLSAEGFQEGDKILLTGSGANTGKYVIINAFSNSGKTIAVTPVDTTLSSETATYTLSLASEELTALLLDKSATGYASFLNREVFIYKAHLSPEDNSIVGEPYLVFKGIVSNGSIDEKPDATSTVSWNLTSHWGDFVQVRGRITSDAFHRALDPSGRPDRDGLIRREYGNDLGFLHSEKAINIISTYQVKEKDYRKQTKSGFLGFNKKISFIPFEVEVDREVDLRFNLQAKYLPVVYGVQRVDSIPVFADTLLNDSKEIYVAYAISEGELGGIYDIYIDDTPSICTDKNDFATRSGQTDEQTIDVVCKGRADKGDVLGGTSYFSGALSNGLLSQTLGFEFWNPQLARDIGNSLTALSGVDFNLFDTGATTTGTGIQHEKGHYFSTPIDSYISFHTGKPFQKANSVLSSVASAGNFKIQNDYYDNEADYWGPSHRLLDTAYAVGKYTISESETQIPELDFVVRGKLIECYNYDYSYSPDLKNDSSHDHTNFDLLDSVTLHNTTTNAQIGSSVKIIDKWSFADASGNTQYRFRFSTNPSLGSVKTFYMKNSSGDRWYFETYDYSPNSGTVRETLNTSITSASSNATQGVDITLTSPSLPAQAAFRYGNSLNLTDGQFDSWYESEFDYIENIASNVVQQVGIANASTFNATTAIPANAIALATSASSSDDIYNGYILRLTKYDADGVPYVQERVITDYIGSEKVAILDNKWDASKTPEAGDSYEILSPGDKRVSINPSMQLLDYLTSNRYGKGLSLQDDIALASFQDSARLCDTRSDVHVAVTGSTPLTVGDVYEYEALGGRKLFQGTIKSSTYRSSTGFTEVVFENVVGKLGRKWEDWKSFTTGDLLWKDGVAYRATGNGTIANPAVSGTSTIVGAALTKVSGSGPSSILVNVSTSSFDGNPLVKAYSDISQTFSKGGYELYDSDDVKYWRYVGWDAQEQRYVTRHQTNFVIDTSKPVFDNINGMLNHFNGILRYSSGRYELDIESTVGVLSEVQYIDNDDIIGAIKVTDSGQKGVYNSVSAAIPDPQNRFDNRTVTFFNSQYLKEDRGVPKQGNFNLPGVTNYFNARINVKQFLDQSRYSLSINFTMMPKGTLLLAGSLISITYPRFGWSNKLFRISNLSFTSDCLAQVSAEEHNNDSYIVSGFDKEYYNNYEPTPITIPTPAAPSNLVATDDERGGITLTWTNGSNFNSATFVTEIWRNSTNDRSSATLLGVTKGTTFLDSVTTEGAVTRYYWVRHSVSVLSQLSSQAAPREIFSPWYPLSETEGESGTSLALLDGINITLSRPVVALASDTEGVVSDFGGSGTDITVTQGTTKFEYDGSGSPAANTFSVTATSPGNVITFDPTPTTVNDGNSNPTIRRYDDITAMSATAGAVVFTVTVNFGNSLSTDFTITQSLSKVSQGVDGIASRTVNLTASDQSIEYSAAGTSPSPDTVTITATALNTEGTPYYEFFVNGSSVQNTTAHEYSYTSPANSSSLPVQIEVHLREGSSSSTVLSRDQISLFGIRPAQSAISAVLSNEAHVLFETEDGTVDYAGSGTSIEVFEGNTQLSYDGTASPANGTFKVTAVGTNITLETSGSPSTSGDARVYADHTAISGNTGYVTYTITATRADGTIETLTRTQSLTKVQEGAAARNVTLTVDDQSISYNTNGASPNPSSITFTATARNMQDTAYYQFFVNGTSVQDSSTTNTYGYTVPTAFTSLPVQVRVDVREGSASGTVIAQDFVTVIGTKPGENAITIILTNEAHTLPTTNTGEVTYAGSGTDIQVYEGNTQLTVDQSLPYSTGTFRVSAVGSGITVGTESEPDINTVRYGDDRVMTADIASVTYTIDVVKADGTTATFTRVQSLSKSIQGDDGGDGDPGLRTVQGYLYYEKTTSGAPDAPTETTYTFATGDIDGGSGANEVLGLSDTSAVDKWTNEPRTQDATSSNTYYTIRYSGTEAAANSSTVEVTYSNVVQFTSFEGVVTFTNGTNGTSVSDGTNTLSFGETGTTTIDGGNITTGQISADRIDVAGVITANSILTTSATIENDIQIGSGESVFKADSNGIYLGNETFANAEFRVTPAGVLNATGATISGAITATSLSLDSGVTIGSANIDSAIVDGAAAGATATQNDTAFAAKIAWGFDESVQGFFVLTNTGTLTHNSDGYVVLDSTSVDPILYSPVIAVDGGKDFIVRARIKRTSPSSNATWQGTLYYQTSGHGESESYKKTISDPTILNEWVVAEWDMSNLSAGGTDWIDSTITRLRFDFGNSASDDFQIDWIAIGTKGAAPVREGGEIISGSVGGVTITDSKLYEGSGNFYNSDTAFYLDSSGNFSLSDKLKFDASLTVPTLTVGGVINADRVTVGSGANAATMSSGVPAAGQAVPRFYTGAEDGEKLFQVDSDGSVHARNIFIYDKDENLVFSSETGFAPLAFTQVASGTSGIKVTSYSEAFANDDAEVEITLEEESTLTVSVIKSVFWSAYGTSSVSFAAAQGIADGYIPDSFDLMLRYSSTSGFSSSQGTRINTPSSGAGDYTRFVKNTDYQVDKTNLFVDAIDLAGGVITSYVSSAQVRKNYLDVNENSQIVLTGNVTLPAGTYYFKTFMRTVDTAYSTSQFKVTSSNSRTFEILDNTADGGFTVDGGASQTVGAADITSVTAGSGLTGGGTSGGVTLAVDTSTIATRSFVTAEITNSIAAKQDASTALTTSTTFGGDVSGTYNAIVVANDSHNHSISTITDEHRLFNNMGDLHNTRQDFNAVMLPGARYLQGGTNGPTGVSSHQFYGFHLGLGDEYGTSTGVAGSYASQLYWPRASLGGATYIYIRDLEAGSWGSWRKALAGSADKWTTARTITLTGDLSGSVSIDGSADVSLSAAVADDSHNHSYFTVTGITDLNSIPDASETRFRPFVSNFQAANRSGANYNGGFDVGTNVTGYRSQFVFEANGFTTPPKFRNLVNGTWGSWYALWHSGNDGSGSGLDADLLDGLHASSFLQSETFAVRDTMTNADAAQASGVYRINTGVTSQPGGSVTDYGTVVHFSNVSDTGFQIGVDYNSPSMYFRGGNSSTFGGGGTNQPWALVWNNLNDGSGSGLDADLLDGLHSSSFLRSDTQATSTASLILASNWGQGSYNSQFVIQGTYPSWETRGDSSQPYGWLHHQDSTGNYTLYSIAGYTDNNWTQRFTFNHGDQTFRNGGPSGNVYYHQGNDGSGSGLDADLLDGLDSGSFIRSDATDTVTGEISFTKSTYPIFVYGNANTSGASATGLQVYSTGGNGALMAFHRGGVYAVNMGLDSDNVLRIGGWSASANRFQLDMSGNLTVAGNVTAYSDIRLKENIKVIPDALEKVQKIRGVTFTRNDQEDKEKLHTGVIAQEVEGVLPEVISEDNLGIKNVAYGNMVGLLIEAIKELKAEVDDLKAQLKEK